MILSVSRRTDIPAFYCDWFFKRLEAGFVYVRNPMSFHVVSKINLSKDVVDCIVFWTKDSSKIIERLDALNGYRYYFQITINGYGKEIEIDVPGLEDAINSFIKLSERIGKEKVIWRYDPIILSDKFDLAYHIKRFNQIAQRLNGFTKRCVISFLDVYPKTAKNLSGKNYKDISPEDMKDIGKKIYESVKKNQYDFKVFTCSEKINLEDCDIKSGKCIDGELISEIFGIKIDVEGNTKGYKKPREECGCIVNRDIGAYNTCANGCLYCYANFNDGLRKENRKLHDQNPNSPLLFGTFDESKGDKLSDTTKDQKSFIVKEGLF